MITTLQQLQSRTYADSVFLLGVRTPVSLPPHSPAFEIATQDVQAEFSHGLRQLIILIVNNLRRATLASCGSALPKAKLGAVGRPRAVAHLLRQQAASGSYAFDEPPLLLKKLPEAARVAS